MAHGLNATCSNREWWSRRPFSGYSISTNPGVNKRQKRFCHKKERKQGQLEIKKQLKEMI